MDATLFKGLYNLLKARGTSLYQDRLFYGGVFSVVLYHTVSNQYCFIRLARGFHGLTGQDLYVIKGLSLVGRHDHKQHRAIKIGTASAERFVVFGKIYPPDTLLVPGFWPAIVLPPDVIPP